MKSMVENFLSGIVSFFLTMAIVYGSQHFAKVDWRPQEIVFLGMMITIMAKVS